MKFNVPEKNSVLNYNPIQRALSKLKSFCVVFCSNVARPIKNSTSQNKSSTNNLIFSFIVVKNWANEMNNDDTQPPWVKYPCRELLECINKILPNLALSDQMETIQQSAYGLETSHQQEEATFQQDMPQHHQVVIPVNMPMLRKG